MNNVRASQLRDDQRVDYTNPYQRFLQKWTTTMILKMQVNGSNYL